MNQPDATQPSAAAPADIASPGQPDSDSLPSSAPDPTADSAGATSADRLYEGTVTLVSRAAVDLDTARPSVANSQLGPTDSLDLYYDRNSTAIRSNSGTVFSFPTGSPTAPRDTYKVCADYAGPTPSYNAATTSAIAVTGTSFCFVTSEGHLAWANIQGVDTSGSPIALKVRVWSAIVD